MNYFKLEEQLLTKQNEKIIASGDVNVDICSFEFDALWDGYVKTAVFYQDKDKVSYAVLNEDNTCTIPAGAMANVAPMFVGIFGIKGSKIMTSTVESIEILEGAISGITIDVKPSEDIFLAIIAQYQAIAEQMNAYDIKADELQTAFAEKAEVICDSFMEKTENIEQSFTELNKNVVSKLNAQDIKLELLGAFDALEVLAIADEVKSENAEIKVRMDDISSSVFTLPNVSIIFVNKVFKIDDARVNVSSLIDVYFDSASFDNAINAKIIVESQNGYIQFICTTAPAYPIGASVTVRRV